MIPIALQKPKVVQPRDPSSVVMQVPCNPHDANEYYEVTLDRESAHRLGLDILIDAERAREYSAAEARRAAKG
jgi:hypothetical protein